MIDGENCIFIVGLPRTGTTIFYNSFAQHPDCAYLEHTTSNNIDNPEKWKVSFFNRMKHKYRRVPQEGGVWRKFHHELEYLGKATQEEKDYYDMAITSTCDGFRKKFFLSKNPSHTLRIKWLYSMYPKAKFIFLYRDYDAGLQSIIAYSRKHWKRDLNHEHAYEHGYEGWLSVNEKFGYDKTIFSEDAIKEYYDWHLGIRDSDMLYVPEEQRMAVHYEEFARDPHKVLDSVFAFAEMRTMKLKLPRITNMNYRHSKRNDDSQK